MTIENTICFLALRQKIHPLWKVNKYLTCLFKGFSISSPLKCAESWLVFFLEALSTTLSSFFTKRLNTAATESCAQNTTALQSRYHLFALGICPKNSRIIPVRDWRPRPPPAHFALHLQQLPGDLPSALGWEAGLFWGCSPLHIFSSGVENQVAWLLANQISRLQSIDKGRREMKTHLSTNWKKKAQVKMRHSLWTMSPTGVSKTSGCCGN
jgi:hypothetical protein